MKRFISTRSFAAAGLALAALGMASAAHARSDVYLSIGVQSPGGYVQPAPVYVQPRPVYVQPQPVYVQPRPVYVAPHPVYVPAPHHYGYYRHGDGRRHDRHHGWERRYGPYGDADRDGIRNQDDRDRDGDGVRNRHDRAPDNRYRY